MKCKICDSGTKELFSKLVLNRHKVAYHQCTKCGFIQTDPPYWLDEAYTSAITSSDLGLLYRNFYLLPITSAIISKYFNTKSTFLDYGGGYGVFTRLMRDQGFNFYRQDTYCENLFAKNFDFSDLSPNSNIELLTAFEVFEHLIDPKDQLNQLLQLSENIFFSTELIPDTDNIDENWWYFIPETGQHISLFSRQSLQYLAEINTLSYYTDGKSLHLFTRKKISPVFFKLLTRYKVAKLYNMIFNKNGSLLNSDYKNSVELSRKSVL